MTPLEEIMQRGEDWKRYVNEHYATNLALQHSFACSGYDNCQVDGKPVPQHNGFGKPDVTIHGLRLYYLWKRMSPVPFEKWLAAEKRYKINFPQRQEPFNYFLHCDLLPNA